jgi:hypothetical protein
MKNTENTESIINVSLSAYKKILQKDPEKLRGSVSNIISKKLNRVISKEDIISINYIGDNLYRISIKNIDEIFNVKID